MQAMQNPAFYNTTVRELATPWTNRDRSVYADLNDSTATVIGMVRDDVPFDQVLYEDIVYVGSSAATARRVLADRQRSLPRAANKRVDSEQHGESRARDAVEPARKRASRRRDGRAS